MEDSESPIRISCFKENCCTSSVVHTISFLSGPPSPVVSRTDLQPIVCADKELDKELDAPLAEGTVNWFSRCRCIRNCSNGSAGVVTPGISDQFSCKQAGAGGLERQGRWQETCSGEKWWSAAGGRGCDRGIGREGEVENRVCQDTSTVDLKAELEAGILENDSAGSPGYMYKISFCFMGTHHLPWRVLHRVAACETVHRNLQQYIKISRSQILNATYTSEGAILV